nr:ribosomal protein S20 [Chroomonas collegionis]
MANSKSAKKRIEINERNRLRNKAYKSTIKTIYKKCLIAIENMNSNEKTKVEDLISLSYSKIDKAVQKGVLHSNTGAAKKASLAKSFKKALA